MLTYCLVCKKNKKKTQRILMQKMIKTKNGKSILLSKCAACGNKKSVFMKEQEAKGLLSNLGIKIKIPLLNVFF